MQTLCTMGGDGKTLSRHRGSSPLTAAVLLAGHGLCFCCWFGSCIRKTNLCPSAFIFVFVLFCGFAPAPWKTTSILSFLCNARKYKLASVKLGRRWGDKSISVCLLWDHISEITRGNWGVEHGAETLYTCCQEPRESRTC